MGSSNWSMTMRCFVSGKGRQMFDSPRSRHPLEPGDSVVSDWREEYENAARRLAGIHASVSVRHFSIKGTIPSSSQAYSPLMIVFDRW